ncbi:MAG: amidohydrolase family protein [Planctomycetia bacterium]|nr:amidohydrolase family protein [Planctomycetia bacterium]
MSRREFLAASGAAAAALPVAAVVARAEPADAPMIIDCHAHIYSEDEKTYPPIEKPYRPPAGKGTIAHLRQELKANGVRRAMAIQTFTFYRWDNRFTADASRANRDVIAGVCTLDPDDTKSPAILERYVKESNVRGVRSIPAKSGRLDDPGVDALWSAAERLRIVVCVLVNRDKRPEIEALAARHPRLPVVIDHCLNVAAGPNCDAIVADMIALAKVPTLHAKLSYVVTGSAEEYPFRDMHESCRQIIKAYSPERCVWGSDFPCELWCPKATYAQHLRVFTHELGLDAETKRQVLGETARRLWFAT